MSQPNSATDQDLVPYSRITEDGEIIEASGFVHNEAGRAVYFHYSGFQDAVNAAKQAEKRQDQGRFELAAVAHAVRRKDGDDGLIDLAKRTGLSATSLRDEYALPMDSLKFLNKPERSGLLSSENLSLNHFRVAAPLAVYSPEGHEKVLTEAANNGDSVTALRSRVKPMLDQLKAEAAAELTASVPKTDTRYATIVIDPPWEMQDIDRDVRPRQYGFDYPTMSEEQLAAFEPMAALPADDCHLYLWTTHKYLPTALRLAEVWGFRYQCLMTWVKNVGITPFSWMYSTELILFCRKGSLDLLKYGKRLDFQAKVREHSRKPDEFYELVREVSPSPRIDVFSREEREGFDSWGNETERFKSA